MNHLIKTLPCDRPVAFILGDGPALCRQAPTQPCFPLTPFWHMSHHRSHNNCDSPRACALVKRHADEQDSTRLRTHLIMRRSWVWCTSVTLRTRLCGGVRWLHLTPTSTASRDSPNRQMWQQLQKTVMSISRHQQVGWLQHWQDTAVVRCAACQFGMAALEQIMACWWRPVGMVFVRLCGC